MRPTRSSSRSSPSRDVDPGRSVKRDSALDRRQVPVSMARTQRRIVVVGSVAFDTLETPFGQADDVLGGSATFFSVAACFFAPVSLVAVVGDDFPASRARISAQAAASTSRGLEQRAGQDVPLARPLPRGHERARHARHAAQRVRRLQAAARRRASRRRTSVPRHIHPACSSTCSTQVRRPRLVGADTMNYWIEGSVPSRSSVARAASTCSSINDEEARHLSRRAQRRRARRGRSSRWARSSVLIKRGEYGALLSTRRVFAVPAYPARAGLRSDGAGDTFAGGFMGYPRASGDFGRSVRRAIVYGSVMASFVVEDFSLDRLRTLDARRRRAALPAVRRAHGVLSRRRALDLSVVFPVYNEAGNVEALVDDVVRACDPLGREYEIVVVDDGSKDGTEDVLRRLKARLRAPRRAFPTKLRPDGGAPGGDHERARRHSRHHGRRRRERSRRHPEAARRVAKGSDMVCGWRQGRWEGSFLSRRLPSEAANRLIGTATNVRLHDYGCQFKVFARTSRPA